MRAIFDRQKVLGFCFWTMWIEKRGMEKRKKQEKNKNAVK
jgi:hypothetical protein